MEMMVAVRETVKMMTTQEMSERTIQDLNKKECKEVDANDEERILLGKKL